jgi:hypothetical protein
MACTNGEFEVPQSACSKDDDKAGTGIRIKDHATSAYNGTYIHQVSNTGQVLWAKGDYKIVPVSTSELRLSALSGSETALVTLTLGADNKITIQGSNATVTYGKLGRPSIPNGSPGACASMMPGDTCSDYTCNDGYVKDGTFVYNGTTFTTQGACVRPTEQKPQGTCTKINPVGLSFPSGSACTLGGDMTGGSTCPFTCAPGYLLSGPASANTELTCKDSVLSQSRTCLPLPSGIFVRATGPEAGHYILDPNVSNWYKDGDTQSYVIAARSTEPRVLELRPAGPSGPGAQAMYTMTIGTTASGTGATATDPAIIPALTVTGPTGPTGAATATSTTAEFVCGPLNKKECTGFSKATATKAKRAGSSTGTRSIATFYPSAATSWKVLLFKQSDASWAGTSMDERYVSLAGTKVTIVQDSTAVEYTATSAGAGSYILTPATASKQMIVGFDFDPIGATTATLTPATTGSGTPVPDSSGGWSTELIAGVSVAASVGALLIIALIVIWIKSQRAK